MRKGNMAVLDVDYKKLIIDSFEPFGKEVQSSIKQNLEKKNFSKFELFRLYQATREEFAEAADKERKEKGDPNTTPTDISFKAIWKGKERKFSNLEEFDKEWCRPLEKEEEKLRDDGALGKMTKANVGAKDAKNRVHSGVREKSKCNVGKKGVRKIAK